MSDNRFEKKDLLRMVNEPLDQQYQRIMSKIIEAYNWTDGDICICFSGGKDSALILDMYCEMVKNFGDTAKPIKVAWANTTNETTAMRKYIPWFIDRCESMHGVSINFNEIRPAKNQNIFTVMQNKGLPFISKMTASIIRKVTKDMKKNSVCYDDIKDLHKPTIECRDRLREMGLSATTVLALTGWSGRRNDFGVEFVLPKIWMPLLDIKRQTGYDIKLSEECCNVLKKEPIKRLHFANMMTGEQATESKSRESSWLQNGCNYFIDNTRGSGIRSKPLGAVSVDAILYAIKKRDIPLCADYGKIIEIPSLTGDINPCFRCEKANRTGCALCGFGVKLDPNRFIRLQESDPSKIAFAFKPINKGGWDIWKPVNI